MSLVKSVARVLLALSVLVLVSAQAASDLPAGAIPAMAFRGGARTGPEVLPYSPQPSLVSSGSVSSGYRSFHFDYAVDASFAFAFQLTVDNDNLFVSDTNGNVVRMYQFINNDAVFVRAFGAAGSGAGQFNGPEQVAVVGNDVYIADFSNNRVQRFNKSTGAYISQFGVYGAGAGQLSSPSGLVYNPLNGFLYVSEVGNERIQIFSTAGIYQGQFGSLGSGDGQLSNPYTLAVDSKGNIYAADSNNSRVEKFDATGAFVRNIAVGIGAPLGVAVDKSNIVWVTSSTSNEVYAYDNAGGYTTYYYGTNLTWFEGYLVHAQGIVVTPPLDVAPFHGTPAIVIADSSSNTVQVFSRSIQPIVHPVITAIPGLGNYNHGIAFDSQENVYITSYSADVVYKYDKFGTYLTQWGGPGAGNGQFSGAMGIAIDDGDNVYVADRNNNRIQKFDSAGGYLSQWGGVGTGDGQFNHPSGVATDGTYLYVTEETGNRVQKFTLSGVYIRQWGGIGSGNGQFQTPVGITADRNRQQVFVVEYDGNRVQEFSSLGDFVKVFTSSTLNGPLGIATDQHGNLYVGDLGNNRIVQFNDVGTFLGSFAADSANGVAFNPKNGQLYGGTVGGNTVTRYGSISGKSDSVGIYRPGTQTFLLRSSLAASTPIRTTTVAAAQPTDLPVTGDWNGDGIDTPGLYRPSTATFYLWDKWAPALSVTTADHVIALGSVGDQPIVGDWDGDGKDELGVFRAATRTFYLRRDLSVGAFTYAVAFGNTTDKGIGGDWDSDGASSAAVYRTADHSFHVTNRSTLVAGTAGSMADDGVYPLGSGGAIPVVGDWTHSGYSGLGVFNPGSKVFLLKNNLDSAPADQVLPWDADLVFQNGFEAGISDIPLAGSWGAALE